MTIPSRSPDYASSRITAEQSSVHIASKSETVLRMHTVAAGEPLTVPNDRALPGCAMLGQANLRDEVMLRLLADWLGPETRLLESAAVPWRYVPGKRCNFQIELVIARGPGATVERQRVVGKVYAKNHGEMVYRMLQEFRTYGFATDRFLVPQPLAYDKRWNLLVLTWAEGELLRSLLLNNAAVSLQIEEAADWLLQLHHCDVSTGPLLTLPRHLQILMTQKQRLVEVYPESAVLLENLLLRVNERGAALAGWMPGPTHGDFSPDHLVFNGGQLTALDFDEFCQYDPMYDVAHFMSHLRLLGLRYFGDINRFDALAERFRSAYEAGAPGYSAQRLRLYHAIAYFKLAHIVAVVVRPPAWKEAVDTFLSEAQQALDLTTG